MSKFLTYITGLRGPEAQIWSEKDLMANGKRVPKLQQQELTPLESNLGIEELKKRYPYELLDKSNDRDV